MESTTKFQEVFGDTIQIKVLEFFLEAGKVSFPIKAIVEGKQISKTQAYKTVNELNKKGFIVEDGIYQKKQYYKLNRKNKAMKNLQSLFKRILVMEICS